MDKKKILFYGIKALQLCLVVAAVAGIPTPAYANFADLILVSKTKGAWEFFWGALATISFILIVKDLVLGESNNLIAKGMGVIIGIGMMSQYSSIVGLVG